MHCAQQQSFGQHHLIHGRHSHGGPCLNRRCQQERGNPNSSIGRSQGGDDGFVLVHDGGLEKYRNRPFERSLRRNTVVIAFDLWAFISVRY